MSVLLDTDVLIWFLAGAPRLGADVRRQIEEQDEPVVVSAVSAFEIATKAAISKLPPIEDLAGRIVQAGFQPLSMTMAHAERVQELPLHHRDPFDRLLVAQAQLEGLTLMTSDEALTHYDVPVQMI